MGYRGLFIWVEGEDDRRFFKEILEPKIQKKYNFVVTRRYAALKKEKIDNFLRSIKAMGADYIYVTDIDNSPCVTAKKQKMQNKLRNIDTDKIIVVIKEIESWYLAGLDKKSGKSLGIKNKIPDTTDTIIKKQLDSLMPKKFDSRKDFMLEILKVFSIEIAEQKNKSFKYFFDSYNCDVC